MPRADNCNGMDVKNVCNRPGVPAAKAKRCRPGHWRNGPFRPAKQAKQHCRTACFERQNGPCGNAKRLPLASMYNPQNEMFRRFRTKCSISQNETYLRGSFSPPHQTNKKAPKKLTSPVLFYCLLIWLSRKKSLILQQIK